MVKPALASSNECRAGAFGANYSRTTASSCFGGLLCKTAALTGVHGRSGAAVIEGVTIAEIEPP